MTIFHPSTDRRSNRSFRHGLRGAGLPALALALMMLAGPTLRGAPLQHARTEHDIDWTSAGVAGVSGGSGTIVLGGVGGPVLKAFLYWHGIDTSNRNAVYDNGTVTVNGQPVTGVPLGDTSTQCWGGGSSRAFRADVTALVPGNGNYLIGGLSADTNHSANGASLVVVFDDGNPANNRDLAFLEGNDGNVADGFPGEVDGWQATLGSIAYAGGTVIAEMHVADGQTFEDSTVEFSTVNGLFVIKDTKSLWDGGSVPSAGTSRALNGELWDIHLFDVTAAFGGVPGPVTLDLSGQAPFWDCVALVALLLDLDPSTAPDIPTSPDECLEIAPRVSGYYNRQCMGAGLLLPGRNGRGPQEPKDPNFLTWVAAVDLRLEALVYQFHTCEDGIDATPPNDPCERAIRELTALLLNIESGQLSEGCGVDLAQKGCAATTVGALVGEVAGLINSGDPDACKQAIQCAGAVNEGQGNVLFFPEAPASSLGSPPADTGGGLPGEDAPSTPHTGGGIGRPAGSGEEESPVPAAAAIARAIDSGAPPSVAPVDTDPATVLVNLEATGLPGSPARDPEPVSDPLPAAEEADPVRRIDRHLAILADPGAADRLRQGSRDALLTALGGGYEPELRLRMVAGLIGDLDPAYRSLLARHLEDILVEARERQLRKLEREAARLLETVQPRKNRE